MKQTATFLAGLGLAIASFSASAGIITFTDSIKRGAAQHMVIDGGSYLLRDDRLGTYDTDAKQYRANLENAAGDNWNLKLEIDGISSTFPAGNTPRCPQAEPGCDTSGWLHFEEDASQTSRLTKSGGLERYVLDVGWGQYGYNAGGVWVTPQDGFAAGFWIKEWTYQVRTSRDLAWSTARTGTGGDVNVYQSVPAPTALGLLGLGLLGVRRLRKAAALRG